jgi:hypothetical protein
VGLFAEASTRTTSLAHRAIADRSIRAMIGKRAHPIHSMVFYSMIDACSAYLYKSMGFTLTLGFFEENLAQNGFSCSPYSSSGRNIEIPRAFGTFKHSFLFKRDQRIKDVEATGDTRKYQTPHCIYMAAAIPPLYGKMPVSVVRYFGCYSAVHVQRDFFWYYLKEKV